MAKKSKWSEWEEKEVRYGHYKNRKTGKLAVAKPRPEGKNGWIIDKGKVKAHPIFRMKVGIVEEGTGNYFFNRSLKDYDWESELIPLHELSVEITA